MYSNIIAPLDGSGFGDSAVAVAASIATRLHTTLRLVHVRSTAAAPLVPQYALPSEPLLADQVHDVAVGHLRRVAEDIRSGGRIEVIEEVLEGDVERSLRYYGEQHAPALFVLTTHARGGFERLMLGSVADALVRRSSQPVLALRPGKAARLADPSAVDLVMLPLDGSHRDEEIFDHARAIGQAMTAEFLLVRVVEPRIDKSRPVVQQIDRTDMREKRAEAQEYLDRISAHLAQYGSSATTHVIVDEDVAGALLALIAERKVDIVAMATRGKGGLDRIVAGSVADRLVRESDVAGVLLYRVT